MNKLRALPQADRYYLIGFKGRKTHLLYFTRYDEYHIACFPNMMIEMGSCCDSHDGITREEAEVQDQFYNELTCPTCLKMAQGNNVIRREI